MTNEQHAEIKKMCQLEIMRKYWPFVFNKTITLDQYAWLIKQGTTRQSDGPEQNPVRPNTKDDGYERHGRNVLDGSVKPSGDVIDNLLSAFA